MKQLTRYLVPCDFFTRILNFALLFGRLAIQGIVPAIMVLDHDGIHRVKTTVSAKVLDVCLLGPNDRRLVVIMMIMVVVVHCSIIKKMVREEWQV